MFISRKVIGFAVAVALFGAGIFLVNIRPELVNAESPTLVQANPRYVFIGDKSSPAIFDTSSGIYRVWWTSDKKTVSTYDFNTHKGVEIDSVSYR
jgi:hypothetical protein